MQARNPTWRGANKTALCSNARSSFVRWTWDGKNVYLRLGDCQG